MKSDFLKTNLKVIKKRLDIPNDKMYADMINECLMKVIEEEATDLPDELYETNAVNEKNVNSYIYASARPKDLAMLSIARMVNVSIEELLTRDLDQYHYLPKQETIVSRLKVNDPTMGIIPMESPYFIEFADVRTAAGSAFVDGWFTSNVDTKEMIYLPFIPAKGKFKAFRIYGDSMEPHVANGSIVIAQLVNDFDLIKNKKDYIVEFNTGETVFKWVINFINKNKKLKLISENSFYDPYEVIVDEVKQVWEAKFYITGDSLQLQS